MKVYFANFSGENYRPAVSWASTKDHAEGSLRAWSIPEVYFPFSKLLYNGLLEKEYDNASVVT